jgi:hypothetical protein
MGIKHPIQPPELSYEEQLAAVLEWAMCPAFQPQATGGIAVRDKSPICKGCGRLIGKVGDRAECPLRLTKWQEKNIVQKTERLKRGEL